MESNSESENDDSLQMEDDRDESVIHKVMKLSVRKGHYQKSGLPYVLYRK